MKRRLFLVLTIVLLYDLASTETSFADAPIWQQIPGPRGGSVAALALSPNYPADHTVFAGLRGHGVYRTDDGGDSWRQVGPSGWVVVALAISPVYASDQTVFATTGLPTTGFRVYRSTDEGSSWQDVTPAWSSPPNAPGLAISPNFVADRTLYVLGGLDTYVSTDGGSTFTRAGGWFGTHNVMELAFSPAYGTDLTLFALVRNEGLYRSIDGGMTWDATGLAGDLSTFALSPDYANDGTLIAASRANGLLHISMDYGDNWAPLEIVLDIGGQHTLLFSPSFATDRVIMAASSTDPGPYRTSDGGTNWSPVGWYDPANPHSGGFVGGSVFALALAPQDAYDAAAFAGTSTGVYLSQDRGVHWYQQYSDPAPLTVRALAVAPGEPSKLLAGTSFFETRINGQPDEYDGNLQLSTDGGQTWRVASGRLARVQDVAFSPDFARDGMAFAATGTPGEHDLSDGGVYLSASGGLTWTQVLSGSFYTALAISPRFVEDGTLWVSAFSEGSGLGIHVSEDRGETWALLPSWVPAHVLVPSPNYALDRTLFAGTHQSGLWKSADAGVSWTPVLTVPVTALAVSPAYGASRTLYAGVREDSATAGAIYRSTDGGGSWQRLETGIPATFEGKPAVVSVLTFAADGSVLAGVYYGNEAGGGAVYRSFDGGESWQAVGVGLGAHSVFALATAPTGSLSFYAGVDGGLRQLEVTQEGAAEPGSWYSNGPRGGAARTLSISPDFASDGVAFAGTWISGSASGEYGPGILKSTDGGQTWQPSASGTEAVFYGSAVHAYAFSPNFAIDRTLFAGTWGGLFKSIDAGESWQRLTRIYFGPPGSITAVAVAPDYVDSGHVLAGSGWGGVFCSRDGGINWSADSSVAAQSAIAYSPAFASDGVAFVGGFEGIYKTADSGAHWTRVLTQPVGALAISPQFAVDGTLFMGGDALYVSNDGGTNWISTPVAPDALHIRALAISPAFGDDRTIFAGMDAGLYRSNDGGAAWEPVVDYPGLPVRSLAISPGWPGHPTLLVGTDWSVYRTTDGGATWVLEQGLATLRTWPIALSRGEGLLLTGARDHGIYGSVDGSATWLPMGMQGGGWAHAISDVAISPAYASDGTLFASWASGISIGGAIFRTTDRGTTWESVFSTDFIGRLAISPAYADDHTIYAAGQTPRILRSTDGGDTWEPVGTWPSGAYAGTTQVALPPNYPADRTVFAGGEGFWRLLPGAAEWELAPGLDSGYYVRSIAISPNYVVDQTLLAAVLWFVEPAGRQRYSVFRSTDGGVNWEIVDAGLLESDQVRDVAFSPWCWIDCTAYATSNRQLYRSLDGGQGWTALGAPPGSPDLFDIVVDSAGDVHVASSAGVWRYTTPARDIIVNGGFEASGGWTMLDTPRPAGYTDQVAYNGQRSARVGIVNDSNTYAYSSARQVVTIPPDATAAMLSLTLYPVSSESATAAQSQVFRHGRITETALAYPFTGPVGDTQYVLIIDPDSAEILQVLYVGLSNVQRWERHTFDLLQYAGQTITIHLGVYNDGQGGWTGMYWDDVSLVISRPGASDRAYVYVPIVLRDYP
jgi:photosystem II stability/assembly factor-like uncharacterized protein